MKKIMERKEREKQRKNIIIQRIRTKKEIKEDIRRMGKKI